MPQPALEPSADTPGTTPLHAAPGAVRGEPERRIVDAAPNAAASDAGLDGAIEDWNCMFRAVLHRLRRAGGDDARAAGAAASSAGLDRTTVLDCVAALEQLHLALADERLRRPCTGSGTAPRGVLDQRSS